jgi:DNA-directed RNA polymerase specialized sigma24 family protein
LDLAVSAGDGWAAAAAMIDSPLLHSLPRWLAGRFPGLGGPGAEDAFADSLYALVDIVNGGDAPRDPLRWVRGTSLNLAMDELARRSRHQGLDAEALQAPAPEATDPTPSRDILRTEALKKARALLPTIHAVRPRQALEVLLDGVEREREITNAQLAEALGVTAANARVLRNRAFKALEEALRHEGVELTFRWAFEVEDLKGEHDDHDSEEEDEA